MRRLIALFVLVASTTLALSMPAHAGGPTSVLVTEPGSGDATALYYSNPGYADLDSMVGEAVPLGAEPKDLGARSVNLTWMAHDVSPWRTQQLYVNAEGGPVVATYENGTTTWARVAEGKAVVTLVDQLLRPGSEPDLSEVDVAATEPVVTEQVVSETTWFSLAGWRWAILGLLVGAGAMLLVRRTRSPEPRQVLVDLDPAAETLPVRR